MVSLWVWEEYQAECGGWGSGQNRANAQVKHTTTTWLTEVGAKALCLEPSLSCQENDWNALSLILLFHTPRALLKVMI